MKSIPTLLLILTMTVVTAQDREFHKVLDSAKTLFNNASTLNQEELDLFDYGKIVSILDQALSLNPESYEARYYLGYTYSRMNSSDARGLINMNLDILLKTSEQFEKVIELTPRYPKELIILDPYSKISSEWGSMATKYWYTNKLDSAVWAFKEGKKRGGFSDFMLAVNRKVLDACETNSIIIAAGDSFTFLLWYLQLVENYRTDVSVIDVSLLNTTWYPKGSVNKGLISFDIPKNQLDSLQYIRWNSTEVTINKFTWKLEPSYADNYLLRGDRLFLSLLKENNFKRNVYLTLGFNTSQMLSLEEHLSPRVYINQLKGNNEGRLSYKKYKDRLSAVLELVKLINPNSPDDQAMFDRFRFETLHQVEHHLSKKHKNKARKLMSLLEEICPQSEYPYHFESGKEYQANLKKRL